jgi:hypothetical protein
MLRVFADFFLQTVEHQIVRRIMANPVNGSIHATVKAVEQDPLPKRRAYRTTTLFDILAMLRTNHPRRIFLIFPFWRCMLLEQHVISPRNFADLKKDRGAHESVWIRPVTVLKCKTL